MKARAGGGVNSWLSGWVGGCTSGQLSVSSYQPSDGQRHHPGAGGRPWVTPEGHTFNSKLSCCPLISPRGEHGAAVLHHPFISRPSGGSRPLLCCPGGEEGVPTASAEPWQPCAMQPPSRPPRSGPEEKHKTNISVWGVSEGTGLKVPFGKRRESQPQTQGCLFCCLSPCLRPPPGCWSARGPAEPPGPSPYVVYHKELTSLIRDVSARRLSTHKHAAPPDGTPQPLSEPFVRRGASPARDAHSGGFYPACGAGGRARGAGLWGLW